jgi:hypothetical protein
MNLFGVLDLRGRLRKVSPHLAAPSRLLPTGRAEPVGAALRCAEDQPSPSFDDDHRYDVIAVKNKHSFWLTGKWLVVPTSATHAVAYRR